MVAKVAAKQKQWHPDRHPNLWGREMLPLWPKSVGSLSIAFHLSLSFYHLALDTDIVTWRVWPNRECKTPAFWPEDQEGRPLEAGKYQGDCWEWREQMRKVGYELLSPSSSCISRSDAIRYTTAFRIQLDHSANLRPVTEWHTWGSDPNSIANALKTEQTLEPQPTKGRSEIVTWA